MCGSCALGMALVAAGRASALVQPPQSPWDWAAGRLLVEEAGGQVLFFELKNGNVVTVESVTAVHYDQNKRSVGFVAGESTLVRQIMDCLQLET